jgi:hypothetical protein
MPVPAPSTVPPLKPPPPSALVPATIVVAAGVPISTQGPITQATIKAGAGAVLGVTVAMNDIYGATVQLLDGTVPVWTVYIPAGTQPPYHFPFGPGLAFGTDIVLTFQTSTPADTINVSVR